MKLTGREFLAQEKKSVTLTGMSGIGKSHMAAQLAGWGWHDYSCDYLIATRYLKDMVADSGALSPTDIACLSDFVGRIGDPAKGGVGLAEFRRRQRLYYEAECAALRDMGEALAAAGAQGAHFVHDSAGSLCEVEDESLLAEAGRQTLFVYMEAAEEDHAEILSRALANPKPLYFPPAFFDANLKTYMEGKGLARTEAIDPADFLAWVFPRLSAARLPKYRRLADLYGVAVPAAAFGNIDSEADFIDLIAAALDARAA